MESVREMIQRANETVRIEKALEYMGVPEKDIPELAELWHNNKLEEYRRRILKYKNLRDLPTFGFDWPEV